ncbi:MAG: hypothetical protein RL213_341 [Bacteroidota bacterium]|jgi:ligand-binding sensor domain-containing protein
MRTRVFRLLFLSVLLVSADVFSQGIPLGIGNWRYHTPFTKAIDVEFAGNRIFCSSSFGLFSYDRTEGEYVRYTKLNGLSDFEISGIYFDAPSGILLIAYVNSNIDLVNTADNSISNISDLKRKNIVGGKKINDVLFLDGLAYLATDFGIVVVDLSRKEVKDTYYIGAGGTNVTVNALAFNGNRLLAATSTGLLTADVGDPNIFNYTGWRTDVNGLAAPSSRYSSATSYNGEFFVVYSPVNSTSDSVFVQRNGSWQVAFPEYGIQAKIDSSGGHLLYSNPLKACAYDAGQNLVKRVDGTVYYPPQIRDACEDEYGQFWMADIFKGLVKVFFNPSYITVYCPTGPFSEAVLGMESRGGTLWVASGSLSGFAPSYNDVNGIYLLHEDEWTCFNKVNKEDTLYIRLSDTGRPSVVTAAVDPGDPRHAFFGNWRGGVMEYNLNGGIRQYDESNSTLLSRAGLADYILVGGITFDKNGTMWVAAGGTTTPINARYADGTWKSFRIPDASASNLWLFQILVDDYNTKWVLSFDGPSAGAGIMAYNENDPSNQNDDSYRQLNDRTGSGGLPDMFVRCMAKDKDGSIWVGTNKGVAVFYNPGDIFTTSGSDAQRIIIEQDGYAQYLLESEYVTSVVVDGANRKWFGTAGGGVFLLSQDGTKQLLNFNVDNSPLPSNNITCMTVDDLTGELFIGTDKGIVSYRSDATQGGDYCDNYYAYPNPVRHDYHGPIAIRGLVDDADVRITDIAGNIVCHTVALGGQAVWNGNDFSGKRAATGVYFAYITNEDGTSTCVTKILLAK